MSRAALLAALDPAWVRDPLYRAAGQLPAVDWRFAQDRSLVDRIRGLPLTFTRTTGRTWVQADGSNGTLGANEPAFIYRNGVSLGLDVWESRTNLFLNTATPATQSITVTAAAHTLSFKGTGTITLSGASTAGPLVGTGANDRVPLVFTPSAGSLTLTLSGTITEPQLELGGNASPFIPTAGLPIQRTGDVCLTTDLSWYDQSAVTFYIECAATNSGGRPLLITNAAQDERFEARVNIEWKAARAAIAGATVGVDSDFTLSVVNGSQGGQVQQWLVGQDGSNLVSASSIGIGRTIISRAPAANSNFSIGSYLGTQTFINGPVSRVAYWPRLLSDGQITRIMRR